MNKPSFHNSARNELGSGIEIKNTNSQYTHKYDYKPKDDKDNVIKSINNFGNIIKNTFEENSKIKPPTRDYTEADFSSSNYKKPRTHRHRDDLQKPKFTYNKEKEDDLQKPQFTNTANEDLQRPQFMNKNLENKDTNFVELNTQGDVM